MPSSRRFTDFQLQTFLAGYPAACAGKVLTLEGKDYTVADIVAVATKLLGASAAVTQTKVAAKQALAEEEAVIAAEGKVVQEARDVLQVMFKGMLPELSSVGIAPPKPRKRPTVEEHAAAVAKARATRLARGTMSKAKKALITGNVTGVTITPVTATPARGPTVGPVVVGTVATHG